RM
ncbi:hypothetical protein ACTFIW_002985, partial [Dictyostelium discoideum]